MDCVSDVGMQTWALWPLLRTQCSRMRLGMARVAARVTRAARRETLQPFQVKRLRPAHLQVFQERNPACNIPSVTMVLALKKVDASLLFSHWAFKQCPMPYTEAYRACSTMQWYVGCPVSLFCLPWWLR